MNGKDISIEEFLGGLNEAFELSEADLEGVVGGTIGPTAQSLLLSAINKYKGEGTTLDEALAALPGLYDQFKNNPMFSGMIAQTNLDEITAFVKDNW